MAEKMGRELSALSQSVGRLRNRMIENQPLRKKAEKIAATIKIPKSHA